MDDSPPKSLFRASTSSIIPEENVNDDKLSKEIDSMHVDDDVVEVENDRDAILARVREYVLSCGQFVLANLVVDNNVTNEEAKWAAAQLLKGKCKLMTMLVHVIASK